MNSLDLYSMTFENDLYQMGRMETQLHYLFDCGNDDNGLEDIKDRLYDVIWFGVCAFFFFFFLELQYIFNIYFELAYAFLFVYNISIALYYYNIYTNKYRR